MATRFQPLKLKNNDLFGVRMSGVMGRPDKRRLQELADKCLERDRTRLVLDLSELDSIGGGGAAVLAEFQERIVAAGGEAVFAGAGDVVRHFVEPKFENLPLRFYLTVKEAENEFFSEVYQSPAATVDETPIVPVAKKTAAKAKPAQVPDVVVEEATAEISEEDPPDLGEVGAMGFFEDEEADSGLDDLLEEFTAEEKLQQRKAHHFTSLTDAIKALGEWSDDEDCGTFGEALGNLLVSHDLAAEALLLVRNGDVLQTTDGAQELSADSPFVEQLVAAGCPLTILDVDADILGDAECTLLENQEPDMLLPVVRNGQLAAVVLLKRGGQDNEYSVAESFALELLIQVIANSEMAGQSDSDQALSSEPQIEAKSEPEPESEPELKVEPQTMPQLKTEAVPVTLVATPTGAGDALLKLAMELPEADDRAHFWNLFVRHSEPLLDVRQLVFLSPENMTPEVLHGDEAVLSDLDLSNERLQMYFRTIERPVATENLPSLLSQEKEDFKDAGIGWLVSLNWDQEYLGSVLVGVAKTFEQDDPTDWIAAVFTQTARLFARFYGSHDSADNDLEIVRIIMAQREKRCYGSMEFTDALVNQLQNLAQDMGFPPDQKRDLIYGCLLRDVGLVGQDDLLRDAVGEDDSEERRRYCLHPAQGAGMLVDLSLPPVIGEVVECHHERYDGSGFPQGLKGRDIPLAARLVAIVEHYVTMTTGAGLPEPLSPEETVEVLRNDQGQRFDPDIVSVFLQSLVNQPVVSEASDETAAVQPDAPEACLVP